MKRCLILNIIKKLKIKNTRYYYALLGQNQEHCQQHITTHWQGCGATGTLIHCQWEQKRVQPLYQTVCQFSSKLNILLYYSALVFLNMVQLMIFVLSVQFSSVTQSCPTLCDPMNCSTPGPVHHQLLESTQTCVH